MSFDTDNYFHTQDWSIKLSEILMIHWNMPNGSEKNPSLTVQITHTNGLRFLSYDTPDGFDAIERLACSMDYTFKLPSNEEYKKRWNSTGVNNQ